MAFTDTVLESARKIALDVVRKYSPTFQWAAVTSTDPLRITYDGRTDPLAVTPSTLVGGLVAGDRVYVVTYMRRAVIIGRAGGAATGIVAVPAYTMGTYTDGTDRFYYQAVDVPMPFTPPPGYAFSLTPHEGGNVAPAMFIGNAASAKTDTVKIFLTAPRKDAKLSSVAWRLVKA